jgi:hypothetical protein
MDHPDQSRLLEQVTPMARRSRYCPTCKTRDIPVPYGLPSGEVWPAVEQPSPDPQLRDLAAVDRPDDHYAIRLFS